MQASYVSMHLSIFCKPDATCYNPTLLALFIHLNFADQIASHRHAAR